MQFRSGSRADTCVSEGYRDEVPAESQNRSVSPRVWFNVGPLECD
jgi:hypothetical protein